MTSLLRSTRLLSLLATGALALAHLAPPARAAIEYIITTTAPSGTTITPSGTFITTSTIPITNTLSNGDTVSLMNNTIMAQMSFSSNKTPLTFRSGTSSVWDGSWFTIIGNGANRLFQFTADAKTITFDHVTLSGGYNSGGAQSGGAINFNGGTAGAVTLAGVFAMNDNYIGSNGGGINVANGMILTIQNAISATNNIAVSNGGAIQIGTGVLIFQDTPTFTGNYAGNQGGAINVGVSASASFAASAVFISNTAGNFGGAIHYHNTSGYVTFLASSTFIANTSGSYGGAIDTQGGSINLLAGGYFKGNTTGIEGGGALYIRGGNTHTIAGNTLFDSNSAKGAGGAILLTTTGLNGPTLILSSTLGNITFINNTQFATTSTSARNAIAIYTSSTITGRLPTITLATAPGNTIAFYDPINTTTNPADPDPSAALALITQNGNGLTLFDTYASLVTATTIINSGEFRLANGAIYGSSPTLGSFTLAATATLSAATAGTLQAATITLDDDSCLYTAPGSTLTLRATTLTSSHINSTGGGNLQLFVTNFDAPALNIATTGTISGMPVTATLIEIGTPLLATSPQTLAFASSAPLTLADSGTIAINFFAANASDRLTVDTLNLDTSGTAFINLLGVGSGTFHVLNSPNSLATAAAGLQPLVNGLTPVGHFSATKSLQNSSKELWIQLTTQNLAITWTGTDGALWKTSGLNWTDGATTDTSFLNGDRVLFNDTATHKTLAIDPTGVIAADITVDNTTGNDYTITGPGSITTSATHTLGPIVTAPTAKLTKTGAGTLNFENTAPNTFRGGIEISAGAIAFTNGAQLGDGGNGIHFTNNATLRANATTTLSNKLTINPSLTATLDTPAPATTLTYTGNLATLVPTATLAKTGPGTLRLTTDNSTATHKTLVQQGTLHLDGPAARLGGPITLTAPGATLAGSGHATGTLTALAGSIIAPGALNASTAATLTINTLTLNNAILSFNLFNTGANDQINTTITTLLAPSTINISAFQPGTYNLGTNLGSLDGATVTINGNAQASGARQVASVSADTAGGSNNLILTAGADISRIITWTGSANNTTWNTGTANFASTGSSILYADGDRVLINDTALPSARAINIEGTGVKVSDLAIDTAATYTITGAAITADPASVIAASGAHTSPITTATGSLLKQGTGTLALQNTSNTFLGGITLEAGAITFTTAAQLATGTAAINITGHSTLANAAPAAQTLANNITLAPGVTGTLDTGSANLTLAGSLGAPLATPTAPSTLVKTGASQLTLAGASPDTANLALQIAQGTLALAATTYAGPINLAPGTLLAANAANTIGKLNLAATSTLSGNGSITTTLTTLNGLVTAHIATDTLTLAGSIDGPGGLLKTGPGELQLNLANAATLANTAPAQIDAGTLRITGITSTTVSYGTSPLTNSGSTIIIPERTFYLTGTTFVLPGTTLAITGSTYIIPSSTNPDSGVITPSSTVTAGTFTLPGYTFTIPDTTITIPSATLTVSGSTIIYPAITYTTTGTTFTIRDITISGTHDVNTNYYMNFTNLGATVPSTTAASTIAQNILLNGGTLALGADTSTAIPVEATANDWRGLRFICDANAAASAITGINDIIYLPGSGAIAPALRGGLIVDLDPGAGNNITLSNTANNFTGAIRLHSGTLQINTLTNLGALGTGASSKIILAGGDLEITGTSFTTTRALELRADAAITTGPGVATTWAGINATGTTFALTKLGTGTLTITAASNAATLNINEGRYNANNNRAAGTGLVTLAPGTIIEFNTGGGAAIPNDFAGSGTLLVTSGSNTLTGTSIAVDRIIITGTATRITSAAAGFLPVTLGTGTGTLNLENGARLNLGAPSTTLGNLTLANNTTLAFTSSGTAGTAFKTATLASLATTGTAGGATLLFNTNLAYGRTDRLTILSAPAGDYNILINNTGPLPANYTAALTLLDAPAPGTATFTTPGRIDAGLNTYNTTVITTPAGALNILITGTGAMSNAASLINAMHGALPLSWFSELDTLSQRLGELRLDTRASAPGLSNWLRASAQQLNFSTRATGRSFHEQQYTASAGLDYKFETRGNTALYIGAYAGYGQTNRDFKADGDGSAQTTYAGLYQTFINPDNGLYLDATLKANRFRNDLRAIAPTGELMTADYATHALGGALELGKRIQVDKGWYAEPSLQAAFTRLLGETYTTSSGIQVELRPASTYQTRLALAFGRLFDYGAGKYLQLYAKAHATRQWTVDGEILATPDGGDTRRYTPKIEGDSIGGGVGLAYKPAAFQFRNTQFYLDLSAATADCYIKPWAITLGLHHQF